MLYVCLCVQRTRLDGDDVQAQVDHVPLALPLVHLTLVHLLPELRLQSQVLALAARHLNLRSTWCEYSRRPEPATSVLPPAAQRQGPSVPVPVPVQALPVPVQARERRRPDVQLRAVYSAA